MKKLVAATKNNWPLILVIVFFLLLNNTSHIFGFYEAKRSHTAYTAMPIINTGDYFVYLSYVEQGKQGHVFMHNLYNHENQQRLMFMPHWYLIGQFSAITGLSTIVSYFIFRLIFSLLLVIMILWWLKKIFPDPKKWWWILSVILLANGFGVLFNSWLNTMGMTATNLWCPETVTFATMTQSPTLIISQILLLLTLILFIKAHENKKNTYLLLAWLANIILVIIHPFDLVIVILVAGAWTILTYHQNQTKKILINYAFLLSANLLSGLYYLWLLQDLVMTQYMQSNILRSAGPLAHLFGLGLIFFLALGGLFYVIKNRIFQNPYLNLMVIWAVTGGLMLCLPLDFNRRLANAWQIPLLIVGIIFLQYLYYKTRTRWRLSLILIVFIFLSFDTIYYTLETTYKLKKYYPVYFFPAARMEIYDLIKNQTQFGDVLLSRDNESGWLPSFTGRKIYSGHQIQTWQFEKKNIEIYNVWSRPQDLRSWLAARQIKYIFASATFLPEFKQIKWLAQESYIEPLLNTEEFIFYKVSTN